MRGKFETNKTTFNFVIACLTSAAEKRRGYIPGPAVVEFLIPRQKSVLRASAMRVNVVLHSWKVSLSSL